MKFVPAAIICLILTSFWYLLHDLDFVVETISAISFLQNVYESPVYAILNLVLNAIHSVSLIWVVYALWWRLKSVSQQPEEKG